MKRILMLNYEFPPLGGGAANACYYMLKEFSKRNIKIDLITASHIKTNIEQFSPNITIHKLYVKKKNMHYWTMKEMLVWSVKAYFYSKKFKEHDITHAWFGWPCGVIAYLLKKPYIVALRGSDVPGYNPRLRILDKLFFGNLSRFIWKRAHKVIANSEELKKLALKTSNIKIQIIPNGIDVNEFKPIDKNNDKLTLISIGRLIYRKGYQFLIPAIKGLDVKLILIGEGNMTHELKEMTKDVEFLGKVKHNDIVHHLQKADLFVLPSLNEGMSNSVLEAMACGLPVIVTNVGGSSELVNGNGFIVKKRNIEELRKTIEKFLNDPELLTKMGKKSREIAEKMNWDNVADEYVKVYGN